MQITSPFTVDGEATQTVRVAPVAETEASVLDKGLEREEELLPRPLPVLGDELGREAFAKAYRNPLLAAAGPLLYFVAQLRDGDEPHNVGEQIDRSLDEIRRIQDRLLASGVAPETMRIMRYVLCATVDDLVLNTSWGSRSEWASRSLLSTLYQETWGGERFFTILEHLSTDPVRNIDALELMAVCLSFGFGGKYRVVERGPAELARVRERLYETIRNVRGELEEDLSPPVKSASRSYQRPVTIVPAWVVVAGTLCLLAGGYAVLWSTLRADAQTVVRQIQALVPPRPVLPVDQPPPVVPLQTQLQRITARVAADLKPGVVEVVADARTITIRMAGSVMFAPGKSNVGPEYAAMIRGIAGILDREPGPISVVGHTDSTGAGRTSNIDLSRERARNVAAILAKGLSDASRVHWDGVGPEQPLYPNTTADGRARNRRVDIALPRTEATPP
jgi:type VI secretion system protein ImpK